MVIYQGHFAAISGIINIYTCHGLPGNMIAWLPLSEITLLVKDLVQWPLTVSQHYDLQVN